MVGRLSCNLRIQNLIKCFINGFEEVFSRAQDNFDKFKQCSSLGDTGQ